MDGNDWNNDDQALASGHQQHNNNGNQPLYHGSHQPQQGGWQPFPSAHQQPQLGQSQQQQYGGQHSQTDSQQQQYGATNFPARDQQAQGGQIGVGGQHNPFQNGNQQPRVQSGGRQQLNNTQQPFTGITGRHLSSASGTNNQNLSPGFGRAAAWPLNQRDVSPPVASQVVPYGHATAQQPAGNNARQQSSNGYTSGQLSDNSFTQQTLPRQRPQGGQPQAMSRMQHYPSYTQRTHQIPHAMHNTSRQFPNNYFNESDLPRRPIEANQSKFQGGQQQHWTNSPQVSPSASQFQAGVHHQYQGGESQFMPGSRQLSGNSQLPSPTAAQFLPGVQQHFAGGSLAFRTQQAQGPTASQAFSPSATDFQPGIQQHYTNNQLNQRGAQYQGQQQFPQVQLSLGAQSVDSSRRQVQQSSFGNLPQDGRVILDGEPMDDADGPEDDGVKEEGKGEVRNDNEPNSKEILEDPSFQQMLLQVKQWHAQHNVPITEDEQVRLTVQEIWKKKNSFKGGKRLAELDENDIAEDAIEEAVRDAKRQRTQHEPLNFHTNAHKVYTQGVENRPEPMDVDNDSVDVDQATSFDLDLEILGLPAEFQGGFSGKTLSLADSLPKKAYEHQIFDRNFRLIESICCDWTFMIEVTKHLRVKDIIMLYSVSKTFHDLVDLRFQSTIAAWAQEISPSGWKVFYWKIYGDLTIKDPAGKLWAMPGPVSIPRPPWAAASRVVSRSQQVRSVPGLKYLAMIAQRETRTRDILACLARAGHRLPETMHVTLKKIWMLMDMPTNNLRRAFIRNENIWTRRDLYNAQMFCVKLQMRFSEPIFGPKTTILADTFLGLREGLNPLWRLLRRKDYLKAEDVLKQRLRYYCSESTVQHYLLVGGTYLGVDPEELGDEHKEGWGTGKMHLSRPDELVIEESVRRHLQMDKHIVFMMFWGHVDWKKRLNLVPTEEEMYMSDDELPPLPKTGKYAAHAMWGNCGNVPFESDNWQPKHSMKARWKTLTREEKLAILKDDQDEQVMALPFAKDVGERFWELPYNSNDTAHPDYPDGEPPSSARHEETEPEDADGDTQMDEADDDEEDISSDSSFSAAEVSLDSDSDSQEQLVDPSSSLSNTLAKGAEGSELVQYEYTYEEESLPMPDTIEDRHIIDSWNELDPYLQQKLIDEQDKLHKQDMKDERTLAIIVHEEAEKLIDAEMARVEAEHNGTVTVSAGPSTVAGPSNHQSSGRSASPYTSPMKKRPKRYTYPNITDPVSLALLAKYDRFAPEEFRTDADGRILRDEQQPASSGSSSSKSTDLSDYDKYDDDDLKALADEEYDSDQIGFNFGEYEKFLKRVMDDGGFRDPNAAAPAAADDPKGKGKGKEKARRKKDVKGKGKEIAVESSNDEDADYDNDYDQDELAYEGDLDDDIALPKYEFRKF